jgi:hypothetical protein
MRQTAPADEPVPQHIIPWWESTLADRGVLDPKRMVQAAIDSAGLPWPSDDPDTSAWIHVHLTIIFSSQVERPPLANLVTLTASAIINRWLSLIRASNRALLGTDVDTFRRIVARNHSPLPWIDRVAQAYMVHPMWLAVGSGVQGGFAWHGVGIPSDRGVILPDTDVPAQHAATISMTNAQAADVVRIFTPPHIWERWKSTKLTRPKVLAIPNTSKHQYTQTTPGVPRRTILRLRGRIQEAHPAVARFVTLLTAQGQDLVDVLERAPYGKKVLRHICFPHQETPAALEQIIRMYGLDPANASKSQEPSSRSA